MWRKRILATAALVAVAACRDPIGPGVVSAAPEALLVAHGCIGMNLPDLVISAPPTLTVTPGSVGAGGTVMLSSWTVMNQGSVASTAFRNGYYLSTDETITASDVFLTENSNAALAPGASFTWTGLRIPLPGGGSIAWGGPRVTIPADMAPGNYFIGILVDRTNMTAESCEWNNYRSAPLTVRGQQIAFESDRDGNSEIYVMYSNGTGVTPLTNNASLDALPAADPAWSPDGSKIAFVKMHSCCYNTEVYVMKADGTAPVDLTNYPLGDDAPAWSPDGAKIAFVSERDADPGTCQLISVMNSDGTGQANLTSGPCDSSPAWSPDGSKIAFARDANPWQDLVYRSQDIYIMNADGTAQRKVTNNAAGLSSSSPAWSPDGSKIAFGQWNRDATSGLYVMNADGTGVTRLTDNGSDRHPAWSRDGRKIAFDRLVDGNEEIFLVNADGSGITRLTNNPANDSRPSWGPLP